MPSWKPKVRWFFAVLFVILTIAMLIYTVRSYYNLPDGKTSINDVPYNELVKASVDGKLGISENLYEVGLLSLGALWGLIIAKKGEAGIILSNNPELITFLCASLLLIFSIVSYVLYSEAIASGLADSGRAFDETAKTIIDLSDIRFDYFFKWQVYNLSAGVIVAIFTLFSAHKLND